MRVLFDAVHGADVGVLGAVEDRLLEQGAVTRWLSREGKDAVIELIEARERPHVVASTAGTDRLSLLRELVARDRAALREARRFRPDLIMTRSPAGVHAGRLTRTPVIYDTDDGPAAGLLHLAGAPLATVVTTPEASEESYGRRHRPYRGYKELFYLHPSRFTPDPAIRDDLGLAPDVSFHLIRLSGLTAVHDGGESGIDDDQLHRLIDLLAPSGEIVISSERPLPAPLEAHRSRARPDRFRHVLAAASLVVGDSQTVCSEAGVLGTPSFRLSSWAGRLAYQNELQDRWGLTTAFPPSEQEAFFAAIADAVARPDEIQDAHDHGLARMLEWAGDPVDDLVALAHELTSR